MTAKQVQAELANYSETEIFTVELTSGENVQCKRDPNGTAVESAYQQTLARETIFRGDIIKPREISRID